MMVQEDSALAGVAIVACGYQVRRMVRSALTPRYDMVDAEFGYVGIAATISTPKPIAFENLKSFSQ